MGATLTAPGSVLSHVSAAAAWGFWSFARTFERITRPGNGGPRRHSDVIVHRSTTLEGECAALKGIPITSPARTLLDLARIGISQRALARAVREATRLDLTSIEDIADCLGRHGRRRGIRRLRLVIARYSGAGEEADLSWRDHKLIIEIDGGPFHLDAGEDARKEALWKRDGWEVRRLPSDEVYKRPDSLLDLAPTSNVPE